MRSGSIVFSGTLRAVIRYDKVLLLEPLQKPEDEEEDDHNLEKNSKDFSSTAHRLKEEMRHIMVRDHLTQEEGVQASVRRPYELVYALWWLSRGRGLTNKELQRARSFAVGISTQSC